MNRLLFALLLIPALASAEYSESDYLNADKNLNTVYKVVLSNAHPKMKPLIVEAQRKWLASVKADCFAIASIPFEGQPTSGYQAEYLSCSNTEKLNRTQFLKTNYLN